MRSWRIQVLEFKRGVYISGIMYVDEDFKRKHMAQQNPEHWFLTPEERKTARVAGVQAYLADKIGVETCKVQILTAKNEHTETAEGLIGHMTVRMDWTTPDGHWHMRNLRFNGELPTGLEDIPKEYVDLLGSFAVAREVQYRNYSVGHNGLPVRSLISDMPSGAQADRVSEKPTVPALVAA